MPAIKSQTRLQLDPWSASSLLQKAIRRGESDLAQYAAETLFRFRGKGIWKRLVAIAFEDVGIASPELIYDLVQAANIDRADQPADNLSRFVEQLSQAPKDRSADYLYLAGAHALTNGRLGEMSCDQLFALVADCHRSWLDRAVATLRLATVGSEGHAVGDRASVSRVLRALDSSLLSPLHQATALAVKKGAHPMPLMLPLVWSVEAGSARRSFTDEPLPSAKRVQGVPLYTFDKHTSLGKQAIRLLCERSSEIEKALAEFAAPAKAHSVAGVAAFYVDAMPVARRLEWDRSIELEKAGIEGEMLSAGCSSEGVAPLRSILRENVDHLNSIREELLLRGRCDG